MQPNVRTIQGELEKAIERVVGERVEVLGSGRTDSGVHALYQVAAFSTKSTLSDETLTRAINAFLPPEIRIWRSREVALDFHPIRDVVRKRYRYLASDSRPFFPFFRRGTWILHRRVDVDLMREAAERLLGTFDFSAFQTQGSPRKTTVRTVFDVRVERIPLSSAFAFPKAFELGISGAPDVETTRERIDVPELIAFEVEANGFLYNMVRAIVGSLTLFGQRHKGFENPERMTEIIESRDRKLGGPTAPAHGLYMMNVVYSDDLK